MHALCEALFVSRMVFYAWRNRNRVANKLDAAVASEFSRYQRRPRATSMAYQIREDGFAVSSRTIGRALNDKAYQYVTRRSAATRLTQNISFNRSKHVESRV